jgi:DNA-binding NarL/FixJ family response regulator
MSSYRIVLADDHVIVRQGIKRMIEEESDLKVIGEVSDGLELLSLLKKLKAHMVIIDIAMPNIGGIEATKEIKKHYPEVKILILTMHKSRELLHHAIFNGADGYMLKEESEKELYSGIEKIRQGGVYISPCLSEELAEDYTSLCRGIPNHPSELLTKREREILKLIADGKSSREISNLLFISTRTVEKHRANIMEKMDAKKTADLVKHAVQKGLIS